MFYWSYLPQFKKPSNIKACPVDIGRGLLAKGQLSESSTPTPSVLDEDDDAGKPLFSPGGSPLPRPPKGTSTIDTHNLIPMLISFIKTFRVPKPPAEGRWEIAATGKGARQ
jgi:hypothetical protein